MLMNLPPEASPSFHKEESGVPFFTQNRGRVNTKEGASVFITEAFSAGQDQPKVSS